MRERNEGGGEGQGEVEGEDRTQAAPTRKPVPDSINWMTDQGSPRPKDQISSGSRVCLGPISGVSRVNLILVRVRKPFRYDIGGRGLSFLLLTCLLLK